VGAGRSSPNGKNPGASFRSLKPDQLWFDQAIREKCELVVKPYLDDIARGIFATRAPARPNPIGLSSVRLLEVCGNPLRVRDIDILNETPLLDIKPYFPQFDCFEVARSGWLKGSTLGRAKADNRFEKKGK